MHKAFANPTTEESQTGVFTIGNDCATHVNVHLFVKFMYEGWSTDMDDHAHDLLVLGDCYECDRIVIAAIDSRKRSVSLIELLID